MFGNTSNLTDDIYFGESLPQQIAKHILKKIIEGEIEAGEKIVEEDISKELNTSRAPVREALYLLQVDGIVERIPRRGTIVKPFSQKEIIEYNDVTIGLIQMCIEFSQGKWHAENKQSLRKHLESATDECEKGNVIEYQKRATQIFRYIFSIANNKALSRFFEEASHILMVFAQSQWNTETMESFHFRLKMSIEAILEDDLVKAKNEIHEALNRGVM
ncbi:GntR family transcriptional regulator [Peribacillus sp. NPDC096447]|uniref:GntR family transcriptional regulator n=1 Tax=Peribacillus sp. NPDC096447 TaxID=3364394 RepID=UPI00382E7964